MAEAPGQLAFMATLMVPYGIGDILFYQGNVSMRTKELMQEGVPLAQARDIARVSSVFEWAIEKVQVGMALRGARPLLGKLGSDEGLRTVGAWPALKHFAKLLALENVEQNAQEAVQDALPLLLQHYWGDEAVPEVSEKQRREFWESRWDTALVMAPIALLGAGLASAKDVSWAGSYLSRREQYLAHGFTVEWANRLADQASAATRPELRGQFYEDLQRAYADTQARPNHAARILSDEAAAELSADDVANRLAQLAAIEGLDEELRALWDEQGSEGGGSARAERLENGEWAVYDAQGELVDAVGELETAKGLVAELSLSEEQRNNAEITEAIEFLEANTGAGRFERTGEAVTLADRVQSGELAEGQAQELIDLYVALGRLPQGTGPDMVQVSGESREVFDAKRQVFELVNLIHEGADASTVFEEHAESYLKQAVASGQVRWEDVARWRRELEGVEVSGADRLSSYLLDSTARAQAAERELTEWFSERATAYVMGRAELGTGVPARVRAFLRRLKEVVRRLARLAAQLMELERAGKLDGDFQMHLARAVGLDEGYAERRQWAEGRAQERAQALAEARGDALSAREGYDLNDEARRQPVPVQVTQGGKSLGGTYQLAWHGTPHRGIEKEGFLLGKIGSGEGAQAYGWGIYFAENKKVAEGYRDKLSDRREPKWRMSYKGHDLTGEYRRQLKQDGTDAERWMINLGESNLGMTLEEILRERVDVLERSLVYYVEDVANPELPEIRREHARKLIPEFEMEVGFAKELLPHLKVSQKRGQLYRVELPENEELLDWEAPLAEQPQKVREAMEAIFTTPLKELRGLSEATVYFDDDWVESWGLDFDESLYEDAQAEMFGWQGADESGEGFYNYLTKKFGGEDSGEQVASKVLLAHGIPGLRYLDGNSRADGKGTYNFVIWDESRLGPDVAKIGTTYQLRVAQQRAEDIEHRKFLEGEPVAQLTGEEFALGEGGMLRFRIAKRYKEQGRKVVDVPEVGSIKLDARAVEQSLRHGGKGRAKIAAFAAVPDVLLKGRIIHKEPLRGTRNGSYIHIAAPVHIAGEPHVVDVVVKADRNGSRMYLHDVEAREVLRLSAYASEGASRGGDVATSATEQQSASADAGVVETVLRRIFSVKADDEATHQLRLIDEGGRAQRQAKDLRVRAEESLSAAEREGASIDELVEAELELLEAQQQAVEAQGRGDMQWVEVSEADKTTSDLLDRPSGGAGAGQELVSGSMASTTGVKARRAMDAQTGARTSAPAALLAFAKIGVAVGRSAGLFNRSGRGVRKRALGHYEHHSHVTRIRNAGDVEVGAHELAHALEDALWGIGELGHSVRLPDMATGELDKLGRTLYGTAKPTSGYLAEGFAEFIRLALTDSQTARSQAPEFAKWWAGQLESRPELKAAFEAGKKAGHTWMQQGALARAEWLVGSANGAQIGFTRGECSGALTRCGVRRAGV